VDSTGVKQYTSIVTEREKVNLFPGTTEIWKINDNLSDN